MSLTAAVAAIDAALFSERNERYPAAIHSVIPAHFVEIPKAHTIYAVDLGVPAGVGPHMVAILHVDKDLDVQRVGIVGEGWTGREEFVTWVGEDVREAIRLGRAALARYADGTGAALFGGAASGWDNQVVDPTWLAEQGFESKERAP